MDTFLLCLLLSLPLHAFPQTLERETRAVWLTTLSGLDWPRQKVIHPQDTLLQQREFCEMLDRLTEANFNTVYLQTRIRGSVIYPSVLEPFDECITGTPGRNPYYDPLQFAILECHKRGLELHAWVVAFPVASFGQAKRQGKIAFHEQRPELVMKTSGTYMLNPGIPTVADYLASLCREIVENYDVDGLHLDYLRYPERELKFDDSKTYKQYHNPGEDLQTWRERNVTSCLRIVSKTVRSIKPWVKVSCSVVGKRQDLPRYSARGWSASGRVAQDVKTWIDEGLVDALVPMIYFDGRDYYPFLQDWIETARGTNTQIIAGLATYRLGSPGWTLNTLRRQIEVSRLMGASGQAYFRARFVTDNVCGNLSLLQTLLYPTTALTPVVLRADTCKPEPPLPLLLSCSQNLKTSEVEWMPSTTPNVHYRIYARFNKTDQPMLVATTEETSYEHISLLFYPLLSVTAIDCFGRESEPLELNDLPVWEPLPQKANPLRSTH